MGISMNCLCVDCILKKHMAAARELGDEETAFQFSKAIMDLFVHADPEENSTVMAKEINRLYMQYYGLPQDRFQEEKRFSNDFVAKHLDDIRRQVAASPNPILTALQYSILGNYIDFSALGKSVSFEVFEQMLRNPEQFAFDTTHYHSFCEKLETAKNLLIVTDNAGEIGFDLVLAETITAQYPHVQITFCVRGMPALNDATREDAEFFRIPFPIIDSGSDIGGTDLRYVNQDTLDALKQSDVIISKGMGNLETLYGSGYPIFFAFLVKCPRVSQIMNKPHMSPMFITE